MDPPTPPTTAATPRVESFFAPLSSSLASRHLPVSNVGGHIIDCSRNRCGRSGTGTGAGAGRSGAGSTEWARKRREMDPKAAAAAAAIARDERSRALLQETKQEVCDLKAELEIRPSL